MKRTMHSITREALAAYPKASRTSWILQWPGQLVLNGSQVGLVAALSYVKYYIVHYTYMCSCGCIKTMWCRCIRCCRSQPECISKSVLAKGCCCSSRHALLLLSLLPGVLDSRGHGCHPEWRRQGLVSVCTQVSSSSTLHFQQMHYLDCMF
jgi:hypothetical protein